MGARRVIEAALPAGLRSRPAKDGDVDVVTEIVAAVETAMVGEADIDREDIIADWRRPSFDLERQSLLVLDEGRPVAEAEVVPSRGRADVSVHPGARGRGIGAALLDWTETATLALRREGDPPSISQYVHDADVDAVALLTSRGYEPRWHSWSLRMELERPQDEPPDLPPGIEARAFDRERDARDVHRLIQDAFSEWRSWRPVAFEDWKAMTLDRSDFDPGLVVLLADGPELIGVALCLAADGEGWIDQLAVRASHRRRGLGRALMGLGFAVLSRAGCRRAGVATDSRTGALALYEGVGMRINNSFTNYAKELRGST
jgi:mycothiol synthase